MINITDEISIRADELKFDFIRSGGPGGQNVNKVATAVQLRFNARESSSLTEEIRDRLCSLAGKKLTEDGIIVITANRFRTQEGNRRDAVNRLANLIKRASLKPKTRKPTSPSAQSIVRRLEDKRIKAEIKKLRKDNSMPDD